ncbi:NfeD family protein [Photobacterium galatheae]|uniref:Serine protease n=1 Tax=Photobacterium galatheae TaxID=1654360 RepID=A0A066RLC0_9GAMM|nr:nodulation protein NfeD [Photobacterium galatheae]KDM89926.1 serine protease [Photobacterium galatheae]MCM0149763.1 nodulation protein NfeD [Photobacterium galatheae]
MKLFSFLALVLTLLCSFSTRADDVWVVTIQGGIGPAVSDFVSREIESAQEKQAKLVILKMDTPGGLDTSMREIIRAITTSSVPVATWVGPAGSRAASAGTYILYASHIAAMAPGTNLGAATPVSLTGPAGGKKDNPFGGQDKPEPDAKDDSSAKSAEKESASNDEVKAESAMEKKVINDAAAYIISLAKLHGRNEVWAERAVREAASLDAEEAFKENVIDLLATDLDDLIRQSDGRTVLINGIQQAIQLQNVAYVEREQDWRFQLLAVITNPNVAYILMLIGIYGLLLEFYNPGVGLPGVLGGICLLLAMYSLQLLPVSYAGLGLIILGIVLMVAEAFSPSFGILGFGGIAAFVMGSVMLMDTEEPGYQIALPLIIGLTVTSALFTFVILTLLLKTRRKPVTTGAEMLASDEGKVVSGFPGEGRVLVEGEIWQARCDTPLRVGQSIVVKHVDGLCLHVEAKEKE